VGKWAEILCIVWKGGEVGMKCEDVFNKAKAVIGAENIDDYRPAIFSTEQDTFLDGVNAYVPNTIMIWLKNGDCIWYRAVEGR
jgi:hypothetical protein